MNFFKVAPVADDVLGTLQRSGGTWRCTRELPGLGALEFRLSGSRQAPDAAAVMLARELPQRLLAILPAIGHALWEHYEPYSEECEIRIAGEAGVWPHARALHVSIEPMRGVLTIEIALAAAWDEEHTLGARIQNWTLLELCGSI